MSYEKVAEVLGRIGGICVSVTSGWRESQDCGKKLRALETADRALAMMAPIKWDPPSRRQKRDVRMGASLDGAMISIRGEGWKELKIGSVFDVEVRAEQDKPTGEMTELAHAVHNSYVAHLGGPETFGELLWAEARRRDWEKAQDTEVIGDGAPWIWNLASLHFAESRQLVDWYHAKEHLIAAGHALKGDDAIAFPRWLNSHTTTLYQGHAACIADELTTASTTQSDIAEVLIREADYFRNNQRRMNYLEMREEEWLIGSGMIESAAKQFKARFCGPGMRWSRTGAQNLIPIRAAIISHRFDELWSRTWNSPPI